MHLRVIAVSLLFLILILISYEVRGQEVDHVSIYTYEFQRSGGVDTAFGADLDRTGKCYNLNSKAQKARSIDTEGSCVYLYDRPDCKGNRAKVFKHDPGANQFSKIGFDQKVKSLKLCNLKAKRPIYLYPMKEYNGASVKLALDSDGSCVTVPEANQNQASSVKPKYSDYCFVIFNTEDCSGKGVRYRGFGNKGQNNLAEVGIDNQVKSALLCYGEDRPNSLFDCHTENR